MTVTVVGGGVIGASIAYHLALRHVGTTLVTPADGVREPTASWASAGGLKFHNCEPQLAAIAASSLARWPALPAELGDDLGLRLWGSLDLALDDSDLGALRAQREANRGWGIPTEAVKEGDLAAIGAKEVGPIAEGSFVPGGGQASPPAVTAAFLRAAAERGARVLIGSARKLQAHPGGAAVQVDGAWISSDLVVVAAGCWSSGLLDQVGVFLPLRPAAAHMVLTPPTEQRLWPTVSAVSRLLSIKQLPNRAVLIGGGWPARVSPDCSQLQLRPESLERNLGNARRAVPWTGTLPVEKTWCGVDAETPDRLPIVGRVPDLPALYVATGFSLGGFQISPGIGAAVAADLADGVCRDLLSVGPERCAGWSQPALAEFRQQQRIPPAR